MQHRRLVKNLSRWFSQNARDLPWRRTRDPYAIWISEIMLQQTQVSTVVPYYDRWLRRLPTVHALAECSTAQLHKLWEGLGYYTRVRNLQKAARRIVAEHAGEFPTNYEQVLGLPGVGRYTAGAICSIAFGQPTPILDGNVRRVLTRLFAIPGDPRQRGVDDQLWALAAGLVLTACRVAAPGISNPAGALNESLMELGATICTPRQPGCSRCPLLRTCQAQRTDQVERFPESAPRAKITKRRFAAFVVERRGRFLVSQRPAGVVNAHLWEFPNRELNGLSAPAAASELLGAVTVAEKPLFTLRHSITRYRITLEVFRTQPERRLKFEGRWVGPGELDDLAFSSAHRQIADRLRTL